MSGVHCKAGFHIPHGYRFHPTDEDVIKFYLIPSIHHQELDCNILRELEIYGDKDKEPWKLFGEKGKVDVWVLTQVSNKSKSRIERSAGCGTWNGQNNYPIKDADENVIGRKRYFCFDCKDRSKLKGQWGMHEYALEDYEHSYVICHIENREDPKKKKRKTSLGLCEDEQQLLPKRLCYQRPSAPQIDQPMMFRTTSSPQWCNVADQQGYIGFPNQQQSFNQQEICRQGDLFGQLENQGNEESCNHEEEQTLSQLVQELENQLVSVENQTVSNPLGEELLEADFMELFDLINEEEESSTQLQHMTDQLADSQNQGKEEETCNHEVEVEQTQSQPLQNQEEILDNQFCVEMQTVYSPVTQELTVAELLELWDQIS